MKKRVVTALCLMLFILLTSCRRESIFESSESSKSNSVIKWFDCLNGDEMVWGGVKEYTLYFCDLTGDGNPELCSTLSMGSGIIDNRIVIYDYAGGVSYDLSDRGNFDYVLNMQDDSLIVEKRVYMGDELVESGELAFITGIVKEAGENFVLIENEDGSMDDGEYFYVTIDGIRIDENGREIDPMEPTADVILKILDNPKLTHKGEWFPWFAGVAICIFNIASILFADELFRWNLSFQIRNADSAEPSEWEIAGRYLGWTVLAICALVMFITGLE